jgi:hypothetical protein
VTYEDIVQGGPCPAVITRVWTATDNCGNTRTLTQTIVVGGGAGASTENGGEPPAGADMAVSLGEGAWFETPSWEEGRTPDAEAAVVVYGKILVDAPGARAATVLVDGGAALTIADGSLSALALDVAPGGAVELSGASAVLELGSFSLDGTLLVSGGAALISEEGHVGLSPGGFGEVIMDDSTWASALLIDVGIDGPGRMIVLGDGLIVTPLLRIGPWGEVQGEGVIQGTVFNGGDLVPDGLTVDGGFEQEDAGRLVLADRPLEVTGAARLAGGLRVDSVSMWADEEMIVLRAAALSGRFDDLELPDPPPAFRWAVVYMEDRVVLRLVGE